MGSFSILIYNNIFCWLLFVLIQLSVLNTIKFYRNPYEIQNKIFWLLSISDLIFSEQLWINATACSEIKISVEEVSVVIFFWDYFQGVERLRMDLMVSCETSNRWPPRNAQRNPWNINNKTRPKLFSFFKIMA